MHRLEPGQPATCTARSAVGVDSAIIVNNYAGNDSFNGGASR